MTELPPHRSGFVAVIGPANSGKSTFLNAAVRQKVAGVSPRPQTTRRRQLGILTLPGAQFVFMDTPGLQKPKNRLGSSMMRVAGDTLVQADVVLFLADLERPQADEDREFAAWTGRNARGKPLLLVLNKIDAVADAEREARTSACRAWLPDSDCFLISARNGTGVPELLDAVAGLLPEGPALYSEEDVTDLSEREIAADLIREAALRRLRAEVPHGIAVRVDEYRERAESGAYIKATVFVEKESHKAIVIGKAGGMLKGIGSDARARIEEMSGRRVYLELRVKVLPGWRDRADSLRRLGYRPEDD
jgi:GTP-binding protein Era